MFSLYRLFFLGTVVLAWGPPHGTLGMTLHALLIGVRFDTVVACYLLVVPFLLLSIAAFAFRGQRFAARATHVFLVLLGLPCMLILAADVPWFLQFNSRLSSAALQWTESSGYMFGMITHEPSFLVHLVPLIIGYALLWLLLGRASRWYMAHMPTQGEGHLRAFLILVITGGLLFLGMRGRTDEKSPIRTGTAYFCDDPFLNQLGLNPVFTCGASASSLLSAPYTRVELGPDPDAPLRKAAQWVGGQAGLMPSPLARRITPAQPIDSLNVVVILLESMSTFKLGDYGGPHDLMPFLSGLRERSLCFDNAYSAGIHTYNGIWSTLYSFPALYDQQPMQDWLDRRQKGLGQVLRDHGWTAAFFTTHDAQFDNMEGSLLAHGFDRVYSEDDYPAEWVQSTNGVPDHRMFAYAVPRMSTMAQRSPFLAVMMTTSDHKPYILPPDLPFTPRSTAIGDRIVEYVDHALASFFAQAAKEPWYRNTIFVLLGDHGINLGHTYDMPLSFHHVPLILYAPGGQLNPRHVRMPVGQIDVAPTVLGALHVPWTNTTLGIDALLDTRPFISFCADDRIGCLDSTHYFIHRNDGHETLYAYEHLSFRDIKDSLPDKTKAMKDYAFTLMGATQRLVDLDQLDGGK